MENNSIYSKPMYKCAVCGEVYDSIVDRMNCEMKCIKLQEEEKKKAEAEKKAAEKKSDFTEASAALDNAFTLVNKCIEKHGIFKYNGKLKDLDFINMDLFPSKLFHHFWF